MSAPAMKTTAAPARSPTTLVLAEYYSLAVQYFYSVKSRPMDDRHAWVDPANWKERLSAKDWGGVVVLASNCEDEKAAERMMEAVQYAQGNGKKVILL